MSASAFKDYLEMFSDKEWLEELKDWVGNDILEEDTHTFAVPINEVHHLRISEGRWKLLIGHATNLIHAAVDGDASGEELRNIYRYLFVCINCMKYNLDPKAAKKALNIEEYENKYWRKQA